VETLDGRKLPKVLNGKYLKRFYPSICKERDGLAVCSVGNEVRIGLGEGCDIIKSRLDLSSN
jgi:hypothetical protein